MTVERRNQLSLLMLSVRSARKGAKPCLNGDTS